MSVLDGVVGALVGGGLASIGYAIRRRQDLKDAAAKREQDLKDAAAKREQDLKDAAAKREQDLKDAAAREELGLVRGFHEVAYSLETRLETAVLIIGRPAVANITQVQRETYLQQPIGMAEEVQNLWDVALGRIRNQELSEALGEVKRTVTNDILPPLSKGDLPDPASLRHALQKYREVANRRIGAEL
jgi:hypothetical protein